MAPGHYPIMVVHTSARWSILNIYRKLMIRGIELESSVLILVKSLLASATGGAMEIEFAAGFGMRMTGLIDAKTLAAIVGSLADAQPQSCPFCQSVCRRHDTTKEPAYHQEPGMKPAFIDYPVPSAWLVLLAQQTMDTSTSPSLRRISMEILSS